MWEWSSRNARSHPLWWLFFFSICLWLRQSGLQYIVSKEVESRIGPLPTSIYPDLYSPSVLVNIYSPFQFYKHMYIILCRLSQTEYKYTCLKQIIFAWLIFEKYIINALTRGARNIFKQKPRTKEKNLTVYINRSIFRSSLSLEINCRRNVLGWSRRVLYSLQNHSSSTFAGITLLYCDSKLLEYSQKSKQATQMCSMNFWLFLDKVLKNRCHST